MAIPELQQYQPVQRYDGTAYLEMLQSLLPKGIIWVFTVLVNSTRLIDMLLGTGNQQVQDTVTSSENPQTQDIVTPEGGFSGSVFGRLLSCFASELSRFETRVNDMERELVPGLSLELLPRWEEMLGLPESCDIDNPQTIEERQRAAHAKYYGAFQTVTNQYLVDYAAALGFEITVEEQILDDGSFILGQAIMGAGGNVMGGRGTYAILKITVISGTGNGEQLQCTFARIKPAHTVIVWEGI